MIDADVDVGTNATTWVLLISVVHNFFNDL